jgi:membrane-associated protease RseP (regulator of RpoE activity)
MPAFPLDGGRIARLLLGRIFDDGRAVRIVANLGIFISAWSCFGIFSYPALLFVAPLLIFANYSIRKGEIAAPGD